MCESARFGETADEFRELADIELPPRPLNELEVTPGVMLDPWLVPALIFGAEREPIGEPLLAAAVEPFRPAKFGDEYVEPAERFAALDAFEPATFPCTELLGAPFVPGRPA